jgi:hypothetical protein
MPSVLLDSNVLLLYVVGMTDRRLIRTHKRTRAFAEEDFDLLCDGLGRFGEIWVTPNILTEASNLAAQAAEPGRSAVLQTLAGFMAGCQEQAVPSATVAGRPAFIRLGLADMATLEVARLVDRVLTDDLALYLALMDAGRNAVNFNHIRQFGWSRG